ncbi:MAG TPA: arginine--tRNA ligase [Gemmatimonadales bacterium]|nr:arginine--tRNA ligase [Gemmatimonadales bacterium]
MSEAIIRAELARVAAVLEAPDAAFVLERPRDTGHGDLSTNLAMVLAKQLKTNPRALAAKVVQLLQVPADVVSRTEIAGPGFINFWLAQDALASLLQTIIAAGPAFGRQAFGAGQKVNVEFVSANPTGPLHVGHGRGAVIGDGLASLLEWTGHAVTREFYINDAGVQIDRVRQSTWERVREAVGVPFEIPEGGYHGEYLQELAARFLAEKPELRALALASAGTGPGAQAAYAEGLALCRTAPLFLRQEQEDLLRSMRVTFDRWSSEQAVRDAGKVDAAVALLRERGLTEEKDGALFLKTSQYGDDKDRVLRKSDGSLTYFVPDIAYHIDKHDRGFVRVIDVWGADHHGYIPRMRAALKALGYGDDFFEVALVQLVKVLKGGEEVRMSKRAGDYVTLADLVEWVGVDATRYFFMMRPGQSPFTFDVDLARKQTDENPIFYVQMAHARMSGIFRVAGRAPESAGGDVSLDALVAPEDLELLKKLAVFPDVLAKAARAREPHRVTDYLEDLARLAHGWYHKCRVLGEPPATEAARLALARATRIVLANGLGLLGLSAPDRM